MILKFDIKKDGDNTIVSLKNSSITITKSMKDYLQILNLGKGKEGNNKLAIEAAFLEIYYRMFTKDFGFDNFLQTARHKLHRILDCEDKEQRRTHVKFFIEDLEKLLMMQNFRR